MKSNAEQVLKQIINDNLSNIEAYDKDNISKFFLIELRNRGIEYLKEWFCSDKEITFIDTHSISECIHIYDEFYKLMKIYSYPVAQFVY